MFKRCVLCLLGVGILVGAEHTTIKTENCMEILKEIDALEKEKKADSINRIGHAVFGGIFYKSDKELDERLKLLKLELQSCQKE